ncbi:MAG: decaprenyl-phosphate phosphoribosyltransferase, partial [candidate division Zixibacteria bacterium]|nr:decaprenyl-phosphate phosphoribosyltransferase [candidate division Zixibacteria bacterium]
MMRPKQWAKNSFIFAALIFDRKLTNIPALSTILAGFVVFSLVASIVYITNDISDLEADRKHPLKKYRPIASGKVPVSAAVALAIVLFLIALPATYLLSPLFALICVIYLVL